MAVLDNVCEIELVSWHSGIQAVGQVEKNSVSFICWAPYITNMGAYKYNDENKRV